MPRLFWILSLVIVIGALANPVENQDALWYRLPRLLHWLAHDGWHWIRTSEFRMNAVAPGTEWTLAPGVAWGVPLRLLTIPNLAGFLLLPGLTFRLLVRFGVAPRAAREWMWLIPFSWSYVFQAGSLANDLPATVLVLAAITTSPSRNTPSPRHPGWALVSLALLTGVKQTYFPLLLPVGVIVAGGVRTALRARTISLPYTTALLAVLFLASALPHLLLTHLSSGTWLGLPASSNFQPKHPVAALVVNGFVAVAGNLIPPLCPGVPTWNQFAAQLAGSAWGQTWLRGFDLPGTLPAAMDEMNAPPGLGIVLLLGVAAWISHASPSGSGFTRRHRGSSLLAGLGVVSLLPFLASYGSFQLGRFLGAWFPLVLPWILARPGMRSVPRNPHWQSLALVVCLGTIVMAAISRQRPLWPTRTLLAQVASHPASPPWARQAADAYFWRERFNDRYTRLSGDLGQAATVGWLGYAVGELALWTDPRHRRRLFHVRPDDEPARWQSLGIEAFIVDEICVREAGFDGIREWAAPRGLRIVRDYDWREEFGILCPVTYLLAPVSRPGLPPPAPLANGTSP